MSPSQADPKPVPAPLYTAAAAGEEKYEYKYQNSECYGDTVIADAAPLYDSARLALGGLLSVVILLFHIKYPFRKAEITYIFIVSHFLPFVKSIMLNRQNKHLEKRTLIRRCAIYTTPRKSAKKSRYTQKKFTFET